MLIDRKTGARVRCGDWVVRRNYKGFPSRYQLGELAFDGQGQPMWVRVRKPTERGYVFLNMKPSALQLDWVVGGKSKEHSAAN